MSITQTSGKTNQVMTKIARELDHAIDDITAIVTQVNDLTDGSVSTTNLTLSGTLSTNTISETTAASGVTIDGALIKDAAFDTNVAAAGVTLSGTTLAADGTDANIDITLTPKGTGDVVTASIALTDGSVSDLAVKLGADKNNGIYGISDTQIGIAVEGTLVASADTLGLTADSLRHRVALGTAGAGTVSVTEYGNGRDVTTVLTLTSFVIGAIPAAAAALGVGNIVYSFPAGQHFELVSSLSSLVLTIPGTTVSTDTGLGSVIATGAVSILSGTATFEDRLTGQTISAASGGGTAVSALTAATTGIGTGISLNVAASVKNVFLNSAGTWNVNNLGNLTATGTIVLKWTKM